ncbi:MAG: DUF4867 family protein [Coprococcus sp.]
MIINDLKKKNPSITIHSITEECFFSYGKILNNFDFSGCMDIMSHRDIPSEGVCYIPSDEKMMNDPLASLLSAHFYGGMPIQIGYCTGKNTQLNALEYHKGSEIDIAVTDLILLLDSLQNIHGNTLPSSGVKAFYLPAGTAVELYGTTLHYAPCMINDNGFKSIVVLPAGTNAALDILPTPLCDEDRLLWMQNKWLLAHAESDEASKGAYVGITGPNIEIFY